MHEADWSKRLFAVEGVRADVATLTDGQEVVLLVLRPRRLFLQLPYGSKVPMDADRLRTWTAALVRLAEVMEANGPPSEALERNGLERLLDRRIER